MPRIPSESQQVGEDVISYQGSLFGILPQLLTGSKQVFAPVYNFFIPGYLPFTVPEDLAFLSPPLAFSRR